MLAPHHGKDAELRKVRLAPKNFLNLLEFFRRKAVLFDQFGCNNWIGVRCFARHWRFMLANSRRPLKSLKSAVLRVAAEPSGRRDYAQGGIRVKRTIIALVCGLVAPLAFAQTSTTTTEETTTATGPSTATQTTTSTTYEA